MFKIIFTAVFIGGCLASESQRDSTQVCVELNGRMAPPSPNQGRESGMMEGRPGMMGPYPQGFPPQQPGMYQSRNSQGMPSQGMPPQGMPPQGMPPRGQGMPPPAMYMPPQHFRNRGGLPPQPGMLAPPSAHCDHTAHIMTIKRLEEALAAKDHQIAELKEMIGQGKHPRGEDFRPPGMAPMPSHPRRPDN